MISGQFQSFQPRNHPNEPSQKAVKDYIGYWHWTASLLFGPMWRKKTNKPNNKQPNVGQVLVCSTTVIPSTWVPNTWKVPGIGVRNTKLSLRQAQRNVWFFICSDKIEAGLTYSVPAHSVCIWKLLKCSCTQLQYENLHSKSFSSPTTHNDSKRSMLYLTHRLGISPAQSWDCCAHTLSWARTPIHFIRSTPPWQFLCFFGCAVKFKLSWEVNTGKWLLLVPRR